MLFPGDRGVLWRESMQSFLDFLGLGSQRRREAYPNSPSQGGSLLLFFAFPSLPQRSSSQLSFFPSNAKSSPSAFQLSSSLTGLESRCPRLLKGLCAWDAFENRSFDGSLGVN